MDLPHIQSEKHRAGRKNFGSSRLILLWDRTGTNTHIADSGLKAPILNNFSPPPKFYLNQCYNGI